MPSPTRVARTPGGHVWGEIWRVLAAALVGVLVWSVAAYAPTTGRTAGPTADTNAVGIMSGWIWWDLGIGVLCCLVLLWRRRWPLPIALALNAVAAVSLASTGASAFALISLATTRRWRAITVAVLVALAGSWASFQFYRVLDRGPYWTEIVIALLSVGFCVAAGFYIGERRAFVASLQERALTAEREQSMRVAQAQVAERTRIAREMHDVLAHRISLVAMHSGALTYRTDLTPEQVAETAEIVRSNANLALTELRGVLGVLRDVSGGNVADGAAPERPQPTLLDLSDLVPEQEGQVALTVTGDLAAVPDQTSRSAYRIIQEGLTNVRKHAPSQPASVSIETTTGKDGAGELRVAVRNPTTPTPVAAHSPVTSASEPRQLNQNATPVGSGLGLIGLTERAVLVGGELTYGPDRRGDWVLMARLPWST